MTEMTDTARKASMFKALARASKAARGVFKGSSNNHQKYDYASSEHVIMVSDEAMAPEGLAIIPTHAEIAVRGEYEKRDNSGSRMVPMHVLKRGYLVTHEDGHEVPGEMEWPLEINKGKGVDKAAGSAETTCYAYFLRSLLRLPRLSADDMNYVDKRDGVQQGSTEPAVAMPNTAFQALVARIRAIDSKEKFAAADQYVSKIADALDNGGESQFSPEELVELLKELDAQR